MEPEQETIMLEIMGGMYIQMLRIYDLLAVIGKHTPNADSDISKVIELHESGKVLAPDPALIMDEDEQN